MHRLKIYFVVILAIVGFFFTVSKVNAQSCGGTLLCGDLNTSCTDVDGNACFCGEFGCYDPGTVCLGDVGYEKQCSFYYSSQGACENTGGGPCASSTCLVYRNCSWSGGGICGGGPVSYCNGGASSYYCCGSGMYCNPPNPSSSSFSCSSTPPVSSSPCPGGTNACGNSSYGNLGSCSGSWSYAGSGSYDQWCLDNAGGADAYCYTCNAAAPTPTPTPTCSPTTSCAAQGKNCGTISNGCSNVSCGSCTSPQTCGGGGVANVCGGGGCVPTTSCAAQGKNCGTVWDGCVNAACGTCTGGQTCSAGGVCTGGGCAPTTSCAAQGKNCGTIWDGCSNVSCGSCTSPQTCGGGGVANVCGGGSGGYSCSFSPASGIAPGGTSYLTINGAAPFGYNIQPFSASYNILSSSSNNATIQFNTPGTTYTFSVTSLSTGGTLATCTATTNATLSCSGPANGSAPGTYALNGSGGTGVYSWAVMPPGGGSYIAASSPYGFGVAGTYNIQVTSGAQTATCSSTIANPYTCTGISSVPNPMSAGTANTITMSYTGSPTIFNWGTIAASCNSSSAVCNNYGLTSVICQPTTVSINGASVTNGGAPAACPATNITMNPRHVVTGNLYFDYGNNMCSSGQGIANINRTVTLNNASAAITSTSGVGSSYTVTDTTNFCGSNNRSVTLSALPAGNTIAGYRLGSSGAFTPPSGFSTPLFTFNNSVSSESVDWCIATAIPWFQTTVGDVRFPSLSNTLPSNTIKSATDATNPSVFFSSLTDPLFGAGSASSQNWQAGREYLFNNDFQQGLGGTSYTFYQSQTRKKNLPITTLSGASIDPSTLATGIYRATAANVTVSACSTIPNTRHIVLLVDNAATISPPSNAACALYPTNAVKVAAGGGLFVMAAKGNITITSSVGTVSTDDVNTQLEGYYTSEGSIIINTQQNCAAGTPDNRLNVGGALVANALHPFATSGGGRVDNRRTLCGANLTYPSLKVYMRPDFLTQLTDFYKNTYKTFKEVNP